MRAVIPRTLNMDEAIEWLMQFARDNGCDVEPGATTIGNQDTFEAMVHIERDARDNRPLCAWFNTPDQQRSCYVNLGRRRTVVSYGGKSFGRQLGPVEERLID